VLIITSAGYYFIFNNTSFPEKFHFKNIDQIVVGILLLVFTIVHFLLLYILLLLWQTPSFFIISKSGFLYEPGGISPGLILWEDIAAIEERQLFYNPGSRVYSAPTANFLVIELKDPAKYNYRYNLLLRLIVVLMSKLIKFQTGRSGDIVVNPSDFGSKYEEVKALINKNLEEYQASTAP
jgi:hypothetical protein